MSITDELKQYLDAMEERLAKKITESEAHLVERMRDMQTELLRGFQAHSEGVTIRLRKIEADESNLNAALSQRMDVLERRLLEIEMKLDHTK